MAFTGTPVVKKVSDRLYRITGATLAVGAAGTIGFSDKTVAANVSIDAPTWAPYGTGPLGSDIVTLQDGISVLSTSPVTVAKTGTTHLDFVITLTNDLGVPSTGGTSSMFFGLTAGTGNGGASDYAATVAVKTTPGTGRVPFPQTGPNTAAAVRVDGSSFTLLPGNYRVTATVHTTEPGQLELELDGTAVDNTCFGNANPTAGGHPIVVDAIITVPAGAGSVLAVINPTGNAAALTVTPASGSLTHAFSQKLVIEKLTGSGGGLSSPEIYVEWH